MEPLDWTGLRDAAAEIVQPLRDWLVADICRRVREAGAITSTAQYQIWRAEALGMAEKELRAAVAKQTGANRAAIDALFDDVLDKTARFEENGQLRQLVRAYKAITTQGANRLLKNLWAPGPDGKLYTVREAYDKVMDFAFAQTFSGAADMETALRQATKELVKRGVRTIPRKNGSSVSIEYATRSYVMNRLGAMANAVQQMNHDALGCDGWEVSAHAACAPDHEDVQGRQFSDAEFAALNARLARPIGTLHCGHTASPIIMGVHRPQYSEAELRQMREDNARGVCYEGRHYTLYEAGQKQAEIEAHIRHVKNRVLADEALGDAENLQKHRLMLARYRQEYTRFCRATGQPTRSERLQAAGFGRKQAAKAAWAARAQRAGFTDSVKSSTFRRGSGGDESAEHEQNIHRLITRLDPNDESAKAEIIENFCKLFADSDVENMLVITTDGEVHFLSSNRSKSVNADEIGEKLKGSYNIHTHPKGSTQFSFSDDVDMPCFFEDGSAVMEAVDYKYRYRFERPEGVTWEQWDKTRYDVKQEIGAVFAQRGYEESQWPENMQHILIDETCKRLGIGSCYRRWRVDE